MGLRGGVERDRSLVVRARLLEAALHLRLVRLLEVALRLRAGLPGRILRHLAPPRWPACLPLAGFYRRRAAPALLCGMLGACAGPSRSVILAACSSRAARPARRAGDPLRQRRRPALRSRSTPTLVLPAGPGPFPAVVQLHGCAGLEAQSFRWARWLADRGYVALVVDSFGRAAREGDCRTGPDEPPVTARFDDAFGRAALSAGAAGRPRRPRRRDRLVAGRRLRDGGHQRAEPRARARGAASSCPRSASRRASASTPAAASRW